MLDKIRIVYEDNHLIVAVKPPNLLSQADETGDKDILTELKGYVKETYNKPGDVYLGLVHRMDRPVGGLMVFTRTSKAAARLQAQLSAHEMGREYLLVAQGEIEHAFTLTDWLLKDEKTKSVSVATADTPLAKRAVLHGSPICQKNNLTLCAIRLETGRKHQIRVQMKQFGHPLWGDNRYGSGQAGEQIALWGYKLTLMHPTKKEQMVFYDLPTGSVWEQFSEDIHAQAL